MAERERAEKEQKTKTEGDRRSILDLRGAIDELRVELQRCNLVIEDLFLQRMTLVHTMVQPLNNREFKII